MAEAAQCPGPPQILKAPASHAPSEDPRGSQRCQSEAVARSCWERELEMKQNKKKKTTVTTCGDEYKLNLKFYCGDNFIIYTYIILYISIMVYT